MRKYQQLLLIVIAGVSVCALFIYKTENKRLKDILHVINFFGRDDAASLRCSTGQQTLNGSELDVRRDYSHPLGVWQVIGDGFYAYSSYWQYNQLIPGGVAIVLVVSRPEAVVNFKCSFNYEKKAQRLNGKFRYQRLQTTQKNRMLQFTSYLFYCHISKYSDQPESITFHSSNPYNKSYDNQQFTMKLRNLKLVNSESMLGNEMQPPAVVCLNLQNADSNKISAESKRSQMYQFFVNHQILGIKDFIVYNSDELSLEFLTSLQHLNIALYLMPFNFPFAADSTSSDIRNLIQLDCLLRNDNRAAISLLLAPNEFLYTATAIKELSTILNSLLRVEDNQTQQRFEITVFNVCHEEKQRLLAQNKYHDPQATSKYKLFINRANDMAKHFLQLRSPEDLDLTTRLPSLPLSLSEAFIHRYINCSHINKGDLREWRLQLDENFHLQLSRLKDELMIYI